MICIAALVVTAVVLYLKSKQHHHSSATKPGSIDKNYAQALSISMQFFDVQKCMFSFYSIIFGNLDF